VKDYVLK